MSFSHTSTASFERKLAPRVSRLGFGAYREYYNYLLRDQEGKWELRQLINAITVDQTAFFRHIKQFEHLSNIILPEILEKKSGMKKLRIWSAGCSTGEEAYSIAMVVNEILGQDDSWDVKILASDVDTDALKFAHKGLYSRQCIEKVPSEYLSKYFMEGVGGETGFYSVRKALKKNILFRRLNFVDSEFLFKSLVDIVFCRNVMIYFEAPFKKKLIDVFFRVMGQDGFLCLGASESLIGVDNRFALIGHAIYQKKG